PPPPHPGGGGYNQNDSLDITFKKPVNSELKDHLKDSVAVFSFLNE
ncbi:MAG: hypothetical protein ACI9FJ_000742, partial [Alteromonadaceae bacterium]